jgi:hypothetical protein
MTGISCHPDIEYAQIPGFRPLELDLYRSPGGMTCLYTPR